MSPIVRVVGCAILVLFTTVILRELGFKGVRLIALIASISVLAASISAIESVVGLLGGLGEFGAGKEYAVLVMKIVGVGYISGICSDMCIEFGEVTLSNSVIMFGKVEMLVLSVPCAVSIIEKGVALM